MKVIKKELIFRTDSNDGIKGKYFVSFQLQLIPNRSLLFVPFS